MQESGKGLWNKKFSHIYIEREAVDYPETKKILRYFKNAVRIYIDHYKDIFCRPHQHFMMQKNSPKLILAVKKDHLVYPGAKVCESFGNEHFYYTSTMMNCIYDCEYCYLQGMYPSSNMVVFVNIEDIFGEIDKLLRLHPVYLCISYDTDLLAFEGVTSFVSRWVEYAQNRAVLKVELRTKSANFESIEHIQSVKNVILAWTLSPDQVREKYEKHTPSLGARLESIRQAVDAGWNVRLCFDPLLYIALWKDIYGAFIRTIFEQLSPYQICDVSVGVFRMAKDYLKRIRKERNTSELLLYPFECQEGVYSYPTDLSHEMTNYIVDEMCKYISEAKIYKS